jgi:hypothetical protein
VFREDLAKAGVIFCSISEAIREYPDLVKKYMGSVVGGRQGWHVCCSPSSTPPSRCLYARPHSQVPVGDNYFTALNSAVFSDGSFVYVPKGVKSPMELSTYFRINASETGQVSWPGCKETGLQSNSSIHHQTEMQTSSAVASLNVDVSAFPLSCVLCSLNALSSSVRMMHMSRTLKAAQHLHTTRTSCMPQWWSCTLGHGQRSSTAQYRTGELRLVAEE